MREPITFSRFSMASWAGVPLLEESFQPPVDSPTRIVLDPSWSENPQSDANAFVAGYWEPDPEFTYKNSFILLDGLTGVFAGRLLVDTTLEFIVKWNPKFFAIECAAGRETKLLQHYLEDRAAIRSIRIPEVEMHQAGGKKGTKAKRVGQIQHVINEGRLKMRTGSYINKLFEQARQFDFTKLDNGCHEDGLIDALSRCMGFN